MKFLQCFLPFIVLSLIVTGCGFRSLEDFQEEGEGVIRSLVQDLKTIRTREQLLAASNKLQRQFDALVAIMISGEEFCAAHPEVNRKEMLVNFDLSDQLRVEINRLYRLEGGRQILEKFQEKALFQLDAFKKSQKQEGERQTFIN